jgi:hypothetical protein
MRDRFVFSVHFAIRTMSKKNICFYSNSDKDKLSLPFLQELKQTPWIQSFEFICVDPSPSRPPLPKWLKQAPTIVIAGDPEPVKEGMEVMNWLYTKKMLEQSSKPKSSSANQPNISGELQSWNSEMSGFGDTGYSYLNSDTSVGGNGGELIPGAFTYLNGQSSPGDKQSQQFSQQPSQTGKTKKEMMMDQQLDMYKQQRDLDMPQGPRRL